jgi:AraC-like DNA-binding protein
MDHPARRAKVTAMSGNASKSVGTGLERSCGESAGDWIRQTIAAEGVELIAAWFRGSAYRRHRHDTYAIGLTDRGVQGFGYRGASHVSLPGEVVILHPDEPHDGYAAADGGFGYRLVYVEPVLIFEAMRAIDGKARPLPFAREPVVAGAKLAAAIRDASRDGGEPLAVDDLVARIAEGLLEAGAGAASASASARFDLPAIERARQFLDAEPTRVIRSAELEAVTGLTRYELARQFRAAFGTSPYRYSLLRRLDCARAQIGGTRSLVEIALESGFADQAHFTRMFGRAFGLTPARYATLMTSGGRGLGIGR